MALEVLDASFSRSTVSWCPMTPEDNADPKRGGERQRPREVLGVCPVPIMLAWLHALFVELGISQALL